LVALCQRHRAFQRCGLVSAGIGNQQNVGKSLHTFFLTPRSIRLISMDHLGTAKFMKSPTGKLERRASIDLPSGSE
jgi:hypothetical protein